MICDIFYLIYPQLWLKGLKKLKADDELIGIPIVIFTCSIFSGIRLIMGFKSFRQLKLEHYFFVFLY